MREWTCQVTRLRKAGVTISHVDSHHHVHTRIGLMPCLKQVCQEQSLRKIRIRQTIFPARPLSRFRIDNFLYNRALRRSFICADNFGPFGAFAQTEAMLKRGSSVELMIHPGHPSYVGELHALQRSVNDAFYTRHECISYKDLH